MKLRTLLTLAITITLLTGCASQPNNKVSLSPLKTEPQLLMSVNTLNVVDNRQQKAMAIINKEALMPVNNLASMLAPWFNESILTSAAGRNTMTVEIINAATYVTQYSMSYESESVVEWRVTLASKTKTWSKSYQTGINKDGPLQLSQEEITNDYEVMFLTLLDRMLRDQEFKQALSAR